MKQQINPLRRKRKRGLLGPILQCVKSHLYAHCCGAGGILVPKPPPSGVIETFSDDFSSGDFSEWNTPITWPKSGGSSSNTIVSDGEGGYYYLSHANEEISEGTPGKAYISRDFATKMSVGDQIRIWCTFKYTTPITGDGNLFLGDVEERVDKSPGVRLIIPPTGRIKVNCAKIAQNDILPQASYPVSANTVHTIEWTFTASLDGHSKLTLDGNIIHDVDHPMQPPPAQYDPVEYEYYQMGITANSHSTEKEMIVYSTGFEIS